MKTPSRQFSKNFNSLIIIYITLLFGYIFTRGFYSLFSVSIVVIAFIFLLLFFLGRLSFYRDGEGYISLLHLSVFISIILSFLLYGGLYQEKIHLASLSRMLLVIASLLAASFFVSFNNPLSNNFIKYRLWSLLIIAFLLRYFMVISSPNPHIDTFDLLKYGPLGLLNGQNPYQMVFHNLYKGIEPNYFSYGPGALVSMLLPVGLFNEPRVIYILADILTILSFSVLIRHSFIPMRQKDKIFTALSLLFLFNPMSLYILEQSYLDPLIFSLLAVSIVVLVILKKSGFAFFILGFIISIKPTMIPLPFILALFLQRSVYLFFISILTFLAIMLPFIVWSAKDLFDDLFVFYFTYPVRLDGLTVNSLFFSIFHFNIPFKILLISWIGALFLIFKRRKEGLFIACLSLTIWFFTFYLFNKLAFVNYYYFVGNLLLLSIVLLSLKRPAKTLSSGSF